MEPMTIMETFMNWGDEFMFQLVLIFIAYLLMVIAVLVDLRSGIRKAKERGEFRSSFGFRKSVKKVNEYGNLLLILTVIDFVQMIFLKALNSQIDVNIPILPVLTFFGAFGVGIIEYRSIKEKASDKTKIDDIEKLAMQLARDKELLNKIMVALKKEDKS